MSDFFPMPHIATLLTVTTTTERSGQVTEHYNDAGIIKCLYNPKLAGRGSDRLVEPLVEYKEVGFLWTIPTTQITENDRIRDITNLVDGIVVERGIFVVDEVKNVTDLMGHTHHKTIKLIGVTS